MDIDSNEDELTISTNSHRDVEEIIHELKVATEEADTVLNIPSISLI